MNCNPEVPRFDGSPQRCEPARRPARAARRRPAQMASAVALVLAAACSDGATGPGALDRVVIDRAADTTLFVSESVDLQAVALDAARREVASLSHSVEWTSDAPAIADVDRTTGVVVAKAPGVARVKASVGGLDDVITFRVSHAVAVVEVVLPDGPTLAVDNEFRACAVVRAANGEVITGVEPRWSVSDEQVIGLSDEVGRCTTVSGVQSGSATIVAELAGKRGQGTVRVTSPAPGPTPPGGGNDGDGDEGDGDGGDDDGNGNNGNGNGNGNGNNGNGNGNGNGG